MLRKSLATLPQTLDQTYDRILTAISEEDCEYAMRILQWLTFSARPLSVEEIAEVVAIDVARDPAFDRDEVLEDPLEALNICSSLVTITLNKAEGRRPDYRIIALAHYSVREYLVSDRIKQGQAKQYSMREAECHDAITRGCLKYLMHFTQPISEEALKVSAMATYSAEFWSSHLCKAEAKLGKTSELAVRLFSVADPAYLTWIRLYDSDDHPATTNLSKTLDDIAPPLYYAAQLGLSTITKMLLDAGADVNAQGEASGTVLQAASAGGHEQIVNLLLDAGADIEALGHYWNTAYAGEDYCSALYTASSAGQERVVKALLGAGANVDAQSEVSGSTLQAAAEGGHEQVIKILLDAGADINAHGGYYGTALETACNFGDKDIVEALIESGADVHAQGGEYGNALQAASYSGYEEVVKLLLDKGAEVNAQGGEYGNALQAASYSGYEEVVKLLLDKGAEVNAQGGKYANALQAASLGGYEEVVEMLLDTGAEVNAQGGVYGNALQAASYSGYEEVVKLLLDKGAEVNAQGGKYANALQAASFGDYEEVVEMLLSAGAHQPKENDPVLRFE
jgi:ankyrin repeat protein